MSKLLDQHKVDDVSLDYYMVCPECDLLMRSVDVSYADKVSCLRCGYDLKVYRRSMVEKSLALAMTALILFIPANFLVILRIDLLGLEQTGSVWDSIIGLYRTDMKFIAAVVFLCAFAIPLYTLLCQLYVAWSLFSGKGVHYAVILFKRYQQFKEWGMLEIYLLGVLVSIVKLHSLADLHVGSGLVCFIILLFVQVWLEVVMSPSQVWELLDKGRTHASN